MGVNVKREKRRWGCKTNKRCIYSMSLWFFRAFYFSLSAYQKLINKDVIYNYESPYVNRFSPLWDSAAREMLARGLVLWQWLKPQIDVYRHMLIILFTKPRSGGHTGSLRTAKLTTGDVFIASTTQTVGMYSTVATTEFVKSKKKILRVTHLSAVKS